MDTRASAFAVELGVLAAELGPCCVLWLLLIAG